ncbi:MAG: hypothetical protein OXI01_15430 [Albidovulum sp.]|nr:hypothetical protein [Albidovulum sp.]
MHIPPWTILAGFGALSRRELADLVAVFEDTTLFNVVAGRIRDLAARRGESERTEADAAFEQHVKEASNLVFKSERSDAVLRLQLWYRTREAFGLQAATPLATRTANLRTAEVARCAADELRNSILQGEDEGEAEGGRRGALDRIRSRLEELFSSQAAVDFSEVVGVQASRMLAEAAQKGLLDDATRDVLIERVREQLENAPPELRDQSVEHALKAGDATALTVLATGSSLVGLGVAVELAGFGAYILAAKASAILPFIGGKAAVSGLAVLANPLFIVPMVLGGGALANRQFQKSAHVKLASSLVVQMALTGLSSGRAGLARCLDDFRSLTGRDVQTAGISSAQLHNRKIDLISDLAGNPLPAMPGRPPEALDRPPTGEALDALEQILFPDRKGVAAEAMAVGGLTVGDIVYHAAAIDPQVVLAADFSRTEDLSGIFDLGVFADRFQELEGAALTGAENHLRGYIAEQLVATRLQEQGHQVEWPDTPNNEGYDLTVDGIDCQVKCFQDVNGLVEHFSEYPDIPVYVNAELADRIRESDYAWADRVSFVEGYDRETAETIMRQSIDAAAALDDLNVPVFAVAVSAARNVHAWWQGSQSLQDLPFEVAIDGAIKGGLTAAGGFAGQSIGLLLFGPAGAVVFGALGGTGALFGSELARERLDRVLVADWVQGLDEPTEDFRVALKVALHRKLDILREKVVRLGTADGELVPWIRLRMQDNAVAIAEGIAELEFETVAKGQPSRAKSLLRLMKDTGVHPWAVRTALASLAASLAVKPTAGEVARGRFYRFRSALAKIGRSSDA